MSLLLRSDTWGKSRSFSKVRSGKTSPRVTPAQAKNASSGQLRPLTRTTLSRPSKKDTRPTSERRVPCCLAARSRYIVLVARGSRVVRLVVAYARDASIECEQSVRRAGSLEVYSFMSTRPVKHNGQRERTSRSIVVEEAVRFLDSAPFHACRCALLCFAPPIVAAYRDRPCDPEGPSRAPPRRSYLSP